MQKLYRKKSRKTIKDIYIYIQIDSLTDGWMDKQTDRATQIERNSERQSDRYRERERETAATSFRSMSSRCHLSNFSNHLVRSYSYGLTDLQNLIEYSISLRRTLPGQIPSLDSNSLKSIELPELTAGWQIISSRLIAALIPSLERMQITVAAARTRNGAVGIMAQRVSQKNTRVVSLHPWELLGSVPALHRTTISIAGC